jgi:glutamate formiminotransferase
MRRVPLLAVPNVSEGRDAAALEAIAAGFTATGARLLDLHADPDHHRAVLTLASEPGALAEAIVSGAAAVLARVDLRQHAGVHPRVGALDVAPVVFLAPAQRGAAVAEALVAGDALARELGLPVLLYGALGRPRADLRRGGPQELARRLASGELTPDFGPRRLHPTGGTVLVTARAPLVAFNVELAPPATLATAREIAAALREGGPHGLPGVRALGLELAAQRRVQVSTNIEDPARTTPAQVVAAVRARAPVAGAELVGLAPAAALEGFPADVPLTGRATIEAALDR